MIYSMPATYLSLNAHLVFRTKEGGPLLLQDRLGDTHAYIGGIIRKLDAVPIQIGGVDDHLHILVGFKSTHSVAQIVREVKKHSTEWIRNDVPNFSWQIGYGGFTVSPERVKGVTKYIANQPEHHKSMTFEEERTALIKFAGLDFDPRELQ